MLGIIRILGIAVHSAVVRDISNIWIMMILVIEGLRLVSRKIVNMRIIVPKGVICICLLIVLGLRLVSFKLWAFHELLEC